MDLKHLRNTLAAVALCSAGAAQAALPTYSVSNFLLPSQADDLTFSPAGNQIFSRNRVMTSREDTSHNRELSVYRLDDLSAPVVNIQDSVDPQRNLAGYASLVGDYVYVRRWINHPDPAVADQGIQRCHIPANAAAGSNQCDYNNSALWETVAPPNPSTDPSVHSYTQNYGSSVAQLSSSVSGTDVAVVTIGTGDAILGHTGNDMYVITPTGPVMFASAGQVGYDSFGARTASYIDGRLVVLAATSAGPMAYVFSSLSPLNFQSFNLGSNPSKFPLDMNVAGRAAFFERAQPSDLTGEVSFCDLAITPASGAATDLQCVPHSLGTDVIYPYALLFNRMLDDGLFVFMRFGGMNIDTLVFDTLNPDAATTVRSLTGGAVTEGLMSVSDNDGRIIAVPNSEANTNPFYDILLLTPGTGLPPGGVNNVVVNPQPPVVNPGDSRTVLINLDVTAENLYGAQYSCHADPSILQFVSGEYPALPDILTIPLAYDSSTAVVDGALSLRAPAMPFTGTATMSVLTYLATAPYGTTDVTCDVLGSDIDGNPIVFTVQNGTVTINDGMHVTGGATISGVARLPYGTDWSGTLVTLMINGNTVTTTTDAAGHYSFADVQDGAISIAFDAPRHVAQCLATTVAGSNATLPTARLVTGDINDDNVIDIADFTLMAGRFGSQTGQPRYLAIADLNADGRINIQDLAVLGSHFGMNACTNV